MEELKSCPVFREVAQLVQEVLHRRIENQPVRAAGLVAERQNLQQQINGWAQSLGRPDLNAAIRRELESRWGEANRRLSEIELLLQNDAELQRRQEFSVDPEELVARLNQLETVLGSDNATVANFELALHIDAIRCGSDGPVEMRTCKLGIVPDVVGLVRDAYGVDQTTSDDALPATRRRPRRRTRLALTSSGGVRSTEEQDQALDFALDPRRFAGLPERFFWVDQFQIPERLSWAESHADAVFKRWHTDGIPKSTLAKEFGVSIPTIRQAIRIALARRSSADGGSNQRQD